jgi:hypothetical protein
VARHAPGAVLAAGRRKLATSRPTLPDECAHSASTPGRRRGGTADSGDLKSGDRCGEDIDAGRDVVFIDTGPPWPPPGSDPITHKGQKAGPSPGLLQPVVIRRTVNKSA